MAHSVSRKLHAPDFRLRVQWRRDVADAQALLVGPPHRLSLGDGFSALGDVGQQIEHRFRRRGLRVGTEIFDRVRPGLLTGGSPFRSGEGDVVREALRTRTGKQRLEARNLGLPRAAADQDYEAGMLALRPQREKVVAIARDEDRPMRACPGENLGIKRRHGQDLAQAGNGVAAMA